MANFETGVLTRSKSKINLKKRVKNDPRRFGDDFEIFRKFREHTVSNFKRGILTNDVARLFKRLKFHFLGLNGLVFPAQYELYLTFFRSYPIK